MARTGWKFFYEDIGLTAAGMVFLFLSFVCAYVSYREGVWGTLILMLFCSLCITQAVCHNWILSIRSYRQMLAVREFAKRMSKGKE